MMRGGNGVRVVGSITSDKGWGGVTRNEESGVISPVVTCKTTQSSQ